jgi:hypothetical protein
MNIRKIIREMLEQGNLGGIEGMEILNHYPFNELPDIRANVDWNNRGVKGWGEVNLPSLTNGDAQQGVFGQDDVIDYVNKFKEKFGQNPIFSLNPDDAWFNKVKITNPEFLDWRNNYNTNKQKWVDQYGSGD